MNFHDMTGAHNFQVGLPAVAAATATSDIGIFRVPYALKLVAGTTALSLIAGTALSGANTNTRHINVFKKVGSGSLTEVASRDLVSGTNLAIGANTLTLSADIEFAAGDLIVVVSEKIGSGQDVPALTLSIIGQGN